MSILCVSEDIDGLDNNERKKETIENNWIAWSGRGGSAVLSSLVKSNRTWIAWSYNRGASIWMLGRDSSLRGWSANGIGSTGNWSWFMTDGVQETFGQCSQGSVVWTQEMDLVILVGLLQLRIFYDSMIPRF